MSTKTHIGSRHQIVGTGKRRFVIVAGLTLYGAGDRAVERTFRRAVDASSWLRCTRTARVTVAMTGPTPPADAPTIVTKEG